MKQTYLAVMAALINAVIYAQEGGGDTKKVDINVKTNSDGGGNFWAAPWVWVVGAAVFILLLVALTRGSGRRAD